MYFCKTAVACPRDISPAPVHNWTVVLVMSQGAVGVEVGSELCPSGQREQETGLLPGRPPQLGPCRESGGDGEVPPDHRWSVGGRGLRESALAPRGQHQLRVHRLLRCRGAPPGPPIGQTLHRAPLGRI